MKFRRTGIGSLPQKSSVCIHAEESGTRSELFIAGGSPHRESINQSQIINHRESITKNQSQRINQYVNQSIINHKIGVEIINQSCAGEFWYIVWGHDNAVIFNNRGGWLIHFAKKLKVIFGKLGNLVEFESVCGCRRLIFGSCAGQKEAS